MQMLRHPKTFAALIVALAVGFAAAFAGSTAFGGEEADLPSVSSDAVVRVAEVPGTAAVPTLAATTAKPKAKPKKKKKKAKKRAAKPKTPTTTAPKPQATVPPVATRAPYRPPVTKPQPRATAPPVDEFEEF
jgi:hypothetical protein